MAVRCPAWKCEGGGRQRHRSAPGEQHRCWYAGASQFDGCLKRPQFNATSADGWFDTGDVATIDCSEGYIRIHRALEGCGSSAAAKTSRGRNRKSALPASAIAVTLPSSAIRTNGSASGSAPLVAQSRAPASVRGNDRLLTPAARKQYFPSASKSSTTFRARRAANCRSSSSAVSPRALSAVDL